MPSIGLGLLPIYWYFWKNARDPEYDSPRKWLTVTLAGIVLVHVPRRPHRQQRPGVRIMSTTTQRRRARRVVIARLLGGVPDFRDGVRHRDADHLRDLRNAELAAVHLSSREPTGWISVWAAAVRDEGPAMHWYGWTATTLLGAAVLGLLATKLPESIDQEDSPVAGLDHAAGGGAGSDLRAAVLLAVVADGRLLSRCGLR